MSDTSTKLVNTGNEEQVESSPAKGRTLHIAKPLGHVNTPTLICGAVAALITIVLDLMQCFEGLIASVKEAYQAKPFYLENVDAWHRSWDWVLAVILASLVAYVVLDSAGKGKRILFGVICLTLILMLSPLFMLWGTFWFPVTVIVAVIFAWIFTFVYSAFHIMPCELGMKKVKKKKPKTNKHNNKSPLLKKSRLVKKLKRSDETASFKPIENNVNTDA